MEQKRSRTTNNPSTGGETVSVASKLPMPFTLQLHTKTIKHEPVMGGGSREVVEYVQRYGSPTFVVDGNSFPQNKGPHQQLAAGFAITHGIPKDFWEEWISQQGDSDIVRNGMIFGHSETASTMAEAKEKEREKSGMERLDPLNLPKGLQTAAAA